MSERPEMLVVADEATGKDIASRLGEAALSRQTDPYDALMELARRRWSAVILSAAREDFAGLCRASRRLQREGKVVAVCSAAQEAEVRRLVGEVLDDYFTHPLTQKDVAEIRRAAAPTPPHAGAALTARRLAVLVDAARDVPSLEAAVVEMVREALGVEAAWADADRPPAPVRPLLLAAADSPRVLVPKSPFEPDVAQGAFLSALRECLPALAASARRTESLHKLAITDHLTGAYNRRYFYHLTDQVLLRARQRNLRVTVLLWDIDDFKRYNQSYSYATGDEILRDTVALMKRISRSHDVVARIGGDEFAVLFWDPDRPRSSASRPLEDAFALADRFRGAVARHDFRSLGPDASGTLTISGGLAVFPGDGDTCRELLRKADQALRRAKASGKNAIRLVGKD